MIIGFAGLAGSGKSTAAAYMQERYGAARVSFATPLKEMVRRIYGLSDAQLFGDLKEVVDERYGRSPRQILQWLGTDVCRDILGADVWVNAAMAIADRTQGRLVVIDDVRFPNEVDAIHRRQGHVVRLVYRDRVAAGGDHVSERLVDELDYDNEIAHAASPGASSLHAQLDRLMEALR